MNIIEEHFKKLTDNISFIELKEDSFIDLKGYTIEDYLPLPMVLDTLVEEIQTGNLYEELNIKLLIDGIIYTLGVDKDFKYKNEYTEILYHYDAKIEDYILYRGLKFVENQDYNTAAVHFRALCNINSENVNGMFNYALSLENISKEFIEKEMADKAEVFLLEATNQLEKILDIESSFSLAYYKLGYHYKYYGQFLKANLIWNKYLKLDREEIRADEIRKELELIQDDVNFEQGIYNLNNEEYDLALERFLKLIIKYEEWAYIYYLTGLAYKGNGEFQKAINFLERSIELDEEYIDAYNELGICFYALGDLDNAILIFNRGIDLDNDYKIIFNRGMTYLELGNVEMALEDINTAYELNPKDEFIKEQKDELEKILNLQ